MSLCKPDNRVSEISLMWSPDTQAATAIDFETPLPKCLSLTRACLLGPPDLENAITISCFNVIRGIPITSPIPNG